MTHEFESRETDVGGLSGRQRLSLVAGALLVQNTESTEIQFLTFDGEMPRWLLILVSAAVGSLLTMIVLFFVRRNRD